MKQALLVSAAFVETGGQDMANLALAKYLAQRNWAITIVAQRLDPELAAMPNVTFLHVGKPFNVALLSEPLLQRTGRRAAGSFIADGGAVLVNGGNCPVPAANWVHYVHAAYSASMAGSFLRQIKMRYASARFRADEARAFAVARRLIANSEKTREDLINFCGVDAGRIEVVYLGVNPERFRPASDSERSRIRQRLGWKCDRHYLVFIGALGDSRKGFDTLFHAWQQVSRQPGFDAVLAVVGRGRELPEWRKRAVQQNMGNSMQFMGFRDDVPDILRAADALVAPTRYEPYGLGVHEALCCSLPAFVSASAGVAERYPPELSELLLPDPNDATDLANRLLRWREDPEGWRLRVAPFGAMLRRRTWDDMAADIARILDQTATGAA